MAGLASGRRDACQYRRLRPVCGHLRLFGRDGRDHRHGSTPADRASRLWPEAVPRHARCRRHTRHSHPALGEHDHLRHPHQLLGAEALPGGHSPGSAFGHAVHGGDHRDHASKARHRRQAYPLQLERAASRHRGRRAADPHLRPGDRVDLWRLGDANRGCCPWGGGRPCAIAASRVVGCQQAC